MKISLGDSYYNSYISILIFFFFKKSGLTNVMNYEKLSNKATVVGE